MNWSSLYRGSVSGGEHLLNLGSRRREPLDEEKIEEGVCACAQRGRTAGGGEEGSAGFSTNTQKPTPSVKLMALWHPLHRLLLPQAKSSTI